MKIVIPRCSGKNQASRTLIYPTIFNSKIFCQLLNSFIVWVRIKGNIKWWHHIYILTWVHTFYNSGGIIYILTRVNTFYNSGGIIHILIYLHECIHSIIVVASYIYLHEWIHSIIVVAPYIYLHDCMHYITVVAPYIYLHECIHSIIVVASMRYPPHKTHIRWGFTSSSFIRVVLCIFTVTLLHLTKQIT